MTSLSFSPLLNSILQLFQRKSPTDDYNCIYYLYGNDIMHDVNNRLFTNFLGDIGEFHNWLQPRLIKFFETFGNNFCTKDKRKNRRRTYEYERIVKKKLCNRKAFKIKIARNLKADICSVGCDEKFGGQSAGREEKRRILLLNSIKHHIYRKFQINRPYSP